MDLQEWMQHTTRKVREPFAAAQLQAADACAEDNTTLGALVLCFVGACAHQGWTTDETAAFVQFWILGQELGAGGALPSADGDLIDSLIAPVTLHFRREGAPCSRPWDATGLHALLIWHRAALLAEHAKWDEIVEVELSRWSAGGALTIPLPQSPPALARLADTTPAGAAAVDEFACSPLECKPLREPYADMQYCRDCVAAMYGRVMLVKGFPDRINGEDDLDGVPEHFVGGSRLMYPISTTNRTCWVYVLDTDWRVAGFERFSERPGFDVRVTPTHISLQPFFEDDFESLPALDCDRRSVFSLWTLLLYVVSGVATIRVIEFDGEKFCLLDHRSMYLSSEISRALVPPLEASLRALTDGSPSRFPQLFQESLGKGKSVDRVIATEMARGGILLSEFDMRFRPLADPADDTVTHYRDARDRLLSLRVTEAVHAVSASQEASSSANVQAAQREMTDLNRRMHLARRGPLDSLVRVLAASDRALVLLRVDRDLVVADWACMPAWLNTGDDLPPRGDLPHGLFTDSVELGYVTPLVDAANAWFDSRTPAALDGVLDTITEEIMGPLWEKLGDDKDLLVSPTWFLGLLPLHAARILGPRRAVDMFKSFTYVPSCVLLDQLIGLGPVQIGDCLAGTSTEPVPRAGEELALLETLFGGKPLCDVTPEAVLREPTASIVHLAAHGYARNGGWASGVQLSGTSSGAGYLSLARLLRDGNFSSTGVVNIAACDSGVELRYELLPDEYLSMDHALLACGARTVISSLWELSGPVSLLFSACFYTRIAAGAQVSDAYLAALSAVRRSGESALPDTAVRLLDLVSTTWREDLQREEQNAGVDISHPYFWAAHKCSGWSWGALKPRT
jgi:hypothetical protein